MTANDRILSFIRTYVPYAIGALLAWLFVKTQIDLRGEFQVAIIAVVVAAIQNAYYYVVRLLEVQLPWVGVFLGFPKQPDYIGVDNLWASFVRTAIPTVIGVALFLLANLGFKLDAETQTGLVVILVGIAQALYYATARALVARWSALSWLLGPDTTITSYAKHVPLAA